MVVGASVAAVGCENIDVGGPACSAGVVASGVGDTGATALDVGPTAGAALAAWVCSAWAISAIPPSVADTLIPVTVIFEASAVRLRRRLVLISALPTVRRSSKLVSFAVGRHRTCFFIGTSLAFLQ